jgi:hypothetical protein
MQELYYCSLNGLPKIRNQSGVTSKRGDDKRGSLVRKPLPFQIKNGRKKGSIFLQKKIQIP